MENTDRRAKMPAPELNDEPALDRIQSPLTVRALAEADADAIENLYSAAIATDPGIGPVTASKWKAAMRLPQFNGGRDFLVAETKGALVALAESSLREQPRRFVRYVKIIVHPERRRQGIATRLLRSVLAQGATDSDTELQSTIRMDWAAGVGFLAHFGFKEIEREIFMHSSAILWDEALTLTGVKVRRLDAAREFAQRLADIHNDAYRFDASMGRETAGDMIRRFETCKVWGAFADQDLVGYALVEYDGDVCWLESLAIAPSSQRQGIGGLLAAAALQAEGVNDRISFRLEVSSKNASALRLYRRLGFQVSAERARFAANRRELAARLV